MINKIHYQRSEIFGILSTLIFIDEYCRYCMLSFESNVSYLRENLELINKVKAIQNNKHSCDKMYESIDCDTILLLNSYKHPLIKSSQVEGHIHFF